MKKIHACNKMNFSSNINEVIRTVLNSLFIYFFYKKISHAPKCTKKHQNHQNHQNHQKHQKHQNHQKHKKHKNATKQKHKTQISEQKQKDALKKHLGGKK